MTETGVDAIFHKISNIKSAGVIERYGFEEFLAIAEEVRKKVSDDVWLEVGWEILEGMGLEEFYGCDYDILEALENIPPDSDFIDIQTFLRHTLVETLHDQFELGGTTILLDIEKMLETPASVLIPRIIELRRKEIERTFIPLIGKRLAIYDIYMNEMGFTTEPVDAFHLHDLWITAYGFQVLQLLDLGLKTDIEGINKIQIIMEKLGIKVNVRIAKEPFNNHRSLMSEGMYSLILKRAQKKPKRKRRRINR